MAGVELIPRVGKESKQLSLAQLTRPSFSVVELISSIVVTDVLFFKTRILTVPVRRSHGSVIAMWLRRS